MSADLVALMHYLTELATLRAYRSVNVARSMLSTTLGHVDGTNIGKHPLIVKLMKGLYNKKPPLAKYANLWYVNIILDFISVMFSNEDLSFRVLSFKSAMLLTLSLMLRVSDLANINLNSIYFPPIGVQFSFLKPRKSQRSGRFGTLRLKRFAVNRKICPVACLESYI